MSRYHQSNFSFHQRRTGIAGASLLLVAGLVLSLSAAYGETTPALLGANTKSVSRMLGAGEPLAGGLFNEESSASHSGGIGSTHAYRTRIGYLNGRSCYAFFMKKTGESFKPVEVVGLLYLCANQADWREFEFGGSGVCLIYRANNPKGKASGQTYLAALDETACKLFVYSPEWRPDFNRELWITPDEAPVHREAEHVPFKGELPRRSNSKQSNVPEISAQLFGKSVRPYNAKQIVPDPKQNWTDPKQAARNPKRVRSDAKQGIYLPQLNQVVPAEDPKAANTKRDRRKKRQKQKGAKPSPPPVSGK